jgi:hypothetical protein
LGGRPFPFTFSAASALQCFAFCHNLILLQAAFSSSERHCRLTASPASANVTLLIRRVAHLLTRV